MRFRRWGIFAWLAGAMTAASAAWLATGGFAQEPVRLFVVWTAWASAALFLVAFSARPLHQLLRTALTKTTLRNRRYVGASAAWAHFLHFIGVVWLLNGFAHPEEAATDPVTLVGGGLGFALYFAMGLTSNDASVRAMGAKNWKRLHTFGAWYLWVIFTQSFAGGALVAGNPGSALFFALCLAAVGTRIGAWTRTRSAAAEA